MALPRLLRRSVELGGEVLEEFDPVAVSLLSLLFAEPDDHQVLLRGYVDVLPVVAASREVVLSGGRVYPPEIPVALGRIGAPIRARVDCSIHPWEMSCSPSQFPSLAKSMPNLPKSRARAFTPLSIFSKPLCVLCPGSRSHQPPCPWASTASPAGGSQRQTSRLPARVSCPQEGGCSCCTRSTRLALPRACTGAQAL